MTDMLLTSFDDAADRGQMAALVQAHPAGHTHVVDLPYRLCSWAFDNPGNVALWRDKGGRLLAWAVLQPPFWTIDYGLHPNAPPDAFATLLEWAAEQAKALLDTPFGRPAWFVAIPEGQGDRRRALEAAGFIAQDTVDEPWSQVTLALDARVSMPPCPVKPGFHLRPLQGEAETPAYAALHRAVFGTANMTDDWRREVIRTPGYRPELDLVIEDPSGEPAAFCIGWLAGLAGNGNRPILAGQIEPFGVREDARRYGLAWSLMAEVVSRLRGLGAETVYVQTDNNRDRAYAFYRAAGFRMVESITLFRKDFDL